MRRRILLSPPSNPLHADHPNAIATNPRRNEVYTANGNSDTVSFIDTRRDRVISDDARGSGQRCAPGRETRTRSTSARTGARLYVALGGENALAVIDLDRRRKIGFIPTAWNPTDVDVTPRRREARDHDRERRRGARAAAPGPTRSATAPPATSRTPPRDPRRAPRAASASSARPKNARRPASHALGAAQQPRPRPPPQSRPSSGAIRHVIYVVKENRTYDQVLGDLGKGDGDPALDAVRRGLGAQPPRARPPLHAVRQLLRRRRRLGRRPQLDGRGGRHRLHRQDLADHLLARLAPAPPRARLRARRVRRAVPHRAARRSTARSSAAPPRSPAATCGTTPSTTASRSATTGCTPACRATATARATPRTSPTSTTAASATTSTSASPASTSTARTTPTAMPEWQREFDAYENAFRADPSKDPLPALTILRLPNDHTWGTTPGQAIPESYMADNDLALGRSSRRSQRARSGPTRRSWSPRTTRRTAPTTSTPTARSPT